MGSLAAWFKSLTLVHIFLGYVFLTSSGIIAVLQLSTLLIRPVSPYYYRYSNIILVEFAWYQLMFLATCWSGSKFDIYSHSPSMDSVGREHALVTMNHCYELDFIVGWLGAVHYNMLGSAKIVAKKALKYLPLIGLQFSMTESIFLSRDWKVDQHNLMNDLHKVTLCPRPTWLLLCPEGTRFTTEKHKTSLEYMRRNNLPELQHHLAPRAKGFQAAVTALKGKFPALYDITTGFHTNDTGKEPSFLSMLSGVPFHAELIYWRIDLDDIPTDTEGNIKYLYKIYQFKDEAMDYFHRHDTFRGFSDFKQIDYVDKSHWCLLVETVWVVLLGLPLIVVLVNLLIAGAYTTLAVIALVTLLASLGMRKMIAYTEKSTSSAYGRSSPHKQQ